MSSFCPVFFDFCVAAVSFYYFVWYPTQCTFANVTCLSQSVSLIVLLKLRPFNIFYMLLYISLLLYIFHNIQLEWHCIA